MISSLPFSPPLQAAAFGDVDKLTQLKKLLPELASTADMNVRGGVDSNQARASHASGACDTSPTSSVTCGCQPRC
jgi:hypothetical protein